MAVAIILIGALVFTVGAMIWEKQEHDYDDTPGFAIVSVICICIGLLITVIASINYMSSREALERVEVLEEENAKIGTAVADMVNIYLEHEESTMEKCNAENATFAVLAYPELASSELVSKQLDIYNDNAKKITECRLDAVAQKRHKWWLNFNLW